jgi:hypothetical protein
MKLQLMDVPPELIAKPPTDRGVSGAGGGGGTASGSTSGQNQRGQQQPENTRQDRDIADPAYDIVYQHWPKKFKSLLHDIRDEPYLNLR